MPSRRVVLAIVVGLIVAISLALSATTSSPDMEVSTYGYSVSLETNATLQNLTLYLPLPTSETGVSPVAGSIRDGTADSPDSWRYSLVDTERGRMVRIAADELPAERRADGHRVSVYQFSVRVPADDIIDTDAPYGTEPTITPTDGRHVRPCPNVAETNSNQTCYEYDAPIYIGYDASSGADVGIQLVHQGVNRYENPRQDMYYERLVVDLQGSHDGWIVADGFASTEESS